MFAEADNGYVRVRTIGGQALEIPYANVAIVCPCEHPCLYHTINSTAAPVSHFTNFAALPSRNETS